MKNIFNLKSFFNFLSRNKAYTFIEIFGLSISLMFVILISSYTAQEMSTDNFQEKSDRIYILGNGKHFASAYRIADRLAERYPEIEKVCPMIIFKTNPVSFADQKLNADLLFVEKTFFDIFSFNILNGDRNNVFNAKNYAVISETFARKAFAEKDPMGQTIKLNDSVTVTVNGVMKDIKNSVVPYGDILVRIDNVKFFNSSLDSESYQNAGSVPIFILAKEGADLKSKEPDMLAYFKEIFWIYKNGIYQTATFTPLKGLYFLGDAKTNGREIKQGDWTFVMILISIGALILIFAIINYINLTSAQAGFRAKEMATRRLLGSSRGELFIRLVVESTLLCLISFIIGILLASICLPYANDLLQTNMIFGDIFTPGFIASSVLLILAMGLISGLLPAMIMSNAKPVEAVKGALRKKTKMVYSKVFITFQNAITIALIAASITMTLQINHMINAPLGYNTTNIITISTEGFTDPKDVSTFTNELKQLASVKQVSLSEGTPFNAGNNVTTTYEDRTVSFQILAGDSTYFKMFGFKIIRENNSTATEAYYLTEQALRELSLKEDAVSFPFSTFQVPIAGVVKDFNLRNINRSLDPILLRLIKTEDVDPWNINVEVTGDQFVAFNEVKSVYERLTKLDFNGKFIDQQLEDSFAAQKRTSKILGIFTSIAVILSLLGLLAMSTYYIQQRYREIAVRKVFGSTNSEILRKLVFTFLQYVLIAFVLVTPAIWYFMNQWLSDYSYRITLSPFIFIAAGLICLVISFVTVFWQSYMAANENPANRIKSE